MPARVRLLILGAKTIPASRMLSAGVGVQWGGGIGRAVALRVVVSEA